MKISVKLILILLCLLAENIAWAKSITIQLSDIYQSTNRHFPIIKAAEENISIAKAQLLKARGAFDPKLLSDFNSEPDGGYQNYYSDTELSVPVVAGGARVFAGYRVGRGDWPIYDQNSLTNSGGETRYGLDLPLLRNFAIDPQRAGLQNSKFNIFLQNEKANLVRIDTLARAGLAYWNWIASARTLEYAQQLLDLAIFRQKALERRHDLGDLAHIDSVENKRFIYQRQAALVAAKLNFIRASITLSLYYRDKNGDPLVPNIHNVPKSLPVIINQPIRFSKWINNENQIITKNPTVQLIQKQIQIKNINLKLAKNQLMPELDLTFSTEKQYGKNGDPLLKPTSHFIGLKFSLPLPRREAKGKFRQTQSEIRQLNQQKDFAKQNLSVELRNFLNELDNDRKQVFILRREVKAALEVEKAEIIRFREGDSSLFLVNQREQTTFSARLRELNATIAYYKSKVILQRICAFKSFCKF